MFKKYVLILSVLGFSWLGSAGALAQSLETFDPHANFGIPAQVKASIYVKVPFNGGLKRLNKEETRVGFALTTRVPSTFSYSGLNYNASHNGVSNQKIKVLDLSFGASSGLKGFQFNGHSLTDIKAFYADDEGGKKKKWPLIVGGVVAAFGVLVLVSAVACAADNTDDSAGFFSDPCK